MLNCIPNASPSNLTKWVWFHVKIFNIHPFQSGWGWAWKEFTDLSIYCAGGGHSRSADTLLAPFPITANPSQPQQNQPDSNFNQRGPITNMQPTGQIHGVPSALPNQYTHNPMRAGFHSHNSPSQTPLSNPQVHGLENQLGRLDLSSHEGNYHTSLQFCFLAFLTLTQGLGALRWKGGKGMSVGQDPLLTPPHCSLNICCSMIQFFRPYFERKDDKFWLLPEEFDQKKKF